MRFIENWNYGAANANTLIGHCLLQTIFFAESNDSLPKKVPERACIVEIPETSDINWNPGSNVVKVVVLSLRYNYESVISV